MLGPGSFSHPRVQRPSEHATLACERGRSRRELHVKDSIADLIRTATLESAAIWEILGALRAVWLFDPCRLCGPVSHMPHHFSTACSQPLETPPLASKPILD